MRGTATQTSSDGRRNLDFDEDPPQPDLQRKPLVVPFVRATDLVHCLQSARGGRILDVAAANSGGGEPPALDGLFHVRKV